MMLDNERIAACLAAISDSAKEIPLGKVEMTTADPGHPVVDEPERYRWFLIEKFTVRCFGFTLRDLAGHRDDGGGHHRWVPPDRS
jgi:hypothetical protein